MGDEDDGALRLGRAKLADDVASSALGQQLTQRSRSWREVGRDPGRAGEAKDGPEQATPTQPEPTAQYPKRRAEPQRPPVGPVHARGLNPRLRAELAKPPDDPLCRPPLTFGGRGPMDLLALFEPPPQLFLICRHRRELIRGRPGGGGTSCTFFVGSLRR